MSRQIYVNGESVKISDYCVEQRSPMGNANFTNYVYDYQNGKKLITGSYQDGPHNTVLARKLSEKGNKLSDAEYGTFSNVLDAFAFIIS